ncbi:MAG: S-adenosylmethionine:tRNA ribosyltransferase-isomerase, partial [Planktomarina sp.]|nr:S-adenosylmethionine:tRNA ribosyltransferase-isomerase [Planktomarina sp.]
MKLSDFDFDLPPERIAIRPMSPRGDAKLLVSQAGQIDDAHVRDLFSYFRPGDRLVLNDTKVIPARLFGTRARQSAQGRVEAKIEVTLLEPQASGRWKALIKPLRKLAVGEEIQFAAGLSARCIEKTDGEALLDFSAQGAELDAA